MKSQIPMTYLPSKVEVESRHWEAEVLINYQAYERCLEPAGPLWTTAHFPSPTPLLSLNVPGLELTKFPFVIVADGARVAVLRVSI